MCSVASYMRQPPMRRIVKWLFRCLRAVEYSILMCTCGLWFVATRYWRQTKLISAWKQCGLSDGCSNGVGDRPVANTIVGAILRMTTWSIGGRKTNHIWLLPSALQHAACVQNFLGRWGGFGSKIVKGVSTGCLSTGCLSLCRLGVVHRLHFVLVGYNRHYLLRLESKHIWTDYHR